MNVCAKTKRQGDVETGRQEDSEHRNGETVRKGERENERKRTAKKGE